MNDSLEAIPAAIPGALLIRTKRFADPRGWFSEVYNRKRFASIGIEEQFVQDNLSLNEKAFTLRGLHFQREPFSQAKLVGVLAGSVLDVVVDLRRSSPTYGRHCAFELSAKEGTQLFVPAGLAHGFLTREPQTVFSYKVSKLYSPRHEDGLRFDDATLAIDWGVDPDAIVVSDKDRGWPDFDPAVDYFQ